MPFLTQKDYFKHQLSIVKTKASGSYYTIEGTEKFLIGVKEKVKLLDTYEVEL